ncbi:g3089 [Coccomyxa viridis]|uniref:G3089 protein n=1 Tax=Coccomyxa viridis TaxID=1274662 RepID=A0ABP1FP91_9CHLO
MFVCSVSSLKRQLHKPFSTDEEIDLDVSVDKGLQKLIDTAGAGVSLTSPDWLTQLGRLWGGKSDVPVADAKAEDIQELLGGALFKALYKWMVESGPVYLLPTGPVSSFLVVSDPAAAKHVLRSTDNPNRPIYVKGLVQEVSEFLFGGGFAISGGDEWRVRRKAVGPSLHKAYLAEMTDRVFGPSAQNLCSKLEVVARSGESIDMEACFSQLTLDVIGKAVFNYDFDALTMSSPVIQAVYTALKETEQRATDVLPLWKLQFLHPLIPRQRKASEAVALIRQTTEQLIAKCREMVDAEEQARFGEDYINEADPSVLRFLIASRVEVSSTQLRDDLLSMLVAGHETTGSVLTWTLYLLEQNPSAMAKAHEEVDRVMGQKAQPEVADYTQLKYLMRCVNESMRLYPHPPVLLRRAQIQDELPGGYTVPPGQDVMISVYNIHHSPAVWDDPEAFKPERFPLDEPVPTEANTDYRHASLSVCMTALYIPFSGGPRKCVGDQFALMEAVIALAVLLKRFDFRMVPNQDIGMTTGATIHTQNGLFMTVKERQQQAADAQSMAALEPAAANA